MTMSYVRKPGIKLKEVVVLKNSKQCEETFVRLKTGTTEVLI